MNTKRINIFTYLLLLVVISSGSACSLSKINAQSSNNNSNNLRSGDIIRSEDITVSPTPAYQPPKRISKDIIKTNEKPAKLNERK